jgi:sporulation protein YlmC with PRC-barrel domain
MKKSLLSIAVGCAACLVFQAQAQNTSGQTYQNLGQNQKQIWEHGRMSATGRMHQELRVSKIKGCQIKSQSGQQVGAIKDVLINPTSGRIDFALVSLNHAGVQTPAAQQNETAPRTPASGAQPQANANSTWGASLLGGSGGKEVAVPWILLRPSPMAGQTGRTYAYNAGPHPSFTFTGNQSKLESAPVFNAGTDLSRPGWRHSVFAYYGVTGEQYQGGAFAPGGATSGTQQGQPGKQGQQNQQQQKPGEQKP